MLITLGKMKILALMLGPAGMGLLGLYNLILTAAGIVVGMGLGSSGVRQIAASEDPEEKEVARVGLWSLTWPLALIGGGALWLLRVPVARLTTQSDAYADAIGWLGVAVALSVVSASQIAVLQGFRRMGALAGVKLYGTLLASALGIGAVYLLDEEGIVLTTIAIPVGTIAIALLYARTLPSLRWGRLWAMPPFRQWRGLLGIGSVFVITGAVGWGAQLALRSLIIRLDGLETAGLYQAAWTTASSNVSLLLAALAADYFPRMSGIAGDREAASLLVNQQIRVGLLLGAPLLLLIVAAAPWVLTLLYTSEFSAAAALLQWQIAGDAQKLVGWALSFALIANKDMGRYLLVELSWSAALVLLAALAAPYLGLEGYGITYFAAYLLYLSLLVLLCWRRHKIALSRRNWRLLILLLLLIIGLILVSRYSAGTGLGLGCLFAALLAWNALRELAVDAGVAGVRGGIAGLAARLRR